MKRRNCFELLGTAGLTAATASGATWNNPFVKQWHDSFLEHSRDTVEYTLAVLEAMPASAFESKPNPVQRSFGEQLCHLATANVVYFKVFDKVPFPAGKLPNRGEPLNKFVNQADKSSVRTFVTTAMSYVTSVLGELTESDYLRKDLILWAGAKPHTSLDVCLRAYMHTAHHRGQVITYLRVQGITPPAWKFEPKA